MALGVSRMIGYSVYTAGRRDDVDIALITCPEIKRTLFGVFVCVCEKKERNASILVVGLLLNARITWHASMSCVHECVYCIYMAYLYLCAI